jgi:hypothetical protein
MNRPSFPEFLANGSTVVFDGNSQAFFGDRTAEEQCGCSVAASDKVQTILASRGP